MYINELELSIIKTDLVNAKNLLINVAFTLQVKNRDHEYLDKMIETLEHKIKKVEIKQASFYKNEYVQWLIEQNKKEKNN